MRGKRKKQIRAFLIRELGENKGQALFEKQAETLQALIKSETGKSKSQKKALAQTILPSIALYQALTKDASLKAQAYAYVQKYMLEVVAAKKHASTAKMEFIPGFFAIYRHAFLKIMRASDLWESTQTSDGDSFDVRIRKCLWHTACAENGCAELCRLFCDADNVTYGGLKKIGFTRTKTLGYGGNCCDFHFFRK